VAQRQPLSRIARVLTQEIEVRSVRRNRADMGAAKLAEHPSPSKREIDVRASRGGDAWTDQELELDGVCPSPTSEEQVRALRKKLGPSQAEIARRFGHARYDPAI
jgi:hypothetical protein